MASYLFSRVRQTSPGCRRLSAYSLDGSLGDLLEPRCSRGYPRELCRSRWASPSPRGDLYQGAALVSSLALLHFGQVPFAATALTVFALGLLDRNGLLPAPLRSAINTAMLPALMISGSFAGSFLSKSLCLFAAIGYALKWAPAEWLPANIPEEIPPLPEGQLTGVMCEKILSGEARLKINRNYVRHQIMPPVPNVDIQELSKLLDQIDLHGQIDFLRAQLAADQRFLQRSGSPDSKSDEELIAFAHRSLGIFINSVQTRAGALGNYEKMENYLKHITHYLGERPDERVSFLLRLAIEAGEYCGPGQFEVVEALYVLSQAQSRSVSVRDKIFYCLQTHRQILFSQLYASLPAPNIGALLALNQLHSYNVIARIHGEALGLRMASAENDPVAELDPITKEALSYFDSDRIEEFWSRHTPFDAATALQETIGTSSLPRPDIYQWWRDWAQGKAFSEAFLERLSAGSFELDGTFLRLPLLAMLFDLGILVLDEQEGRAL